MAADLVPARLAVDAPDLAREVASFLAHGFLVVDHALDADAIEALRCAFDDAQHRQPREFIHELLEEDDRFAVLLDNAPVLARIRALLGTCIQLHSATARVAMPGSPAQDWHRDTPWPVDPRGVPYGGVAAQINCGFYLDEVGPDNGPLIVVPGSHRAPFAPPRGTAAFPDERRLLARPGQAVLFDGFLFHRGAANTTTAGRRACLMCYQHAWMKSRERFDGARSRALRERGPDEVRLLLGAIERW